MSTTLQDRDLRLKGIKLATTGAPPEVDYPTLAALVAAMGGVPSTNHWDVVTSYSVDKLNQILQAQYGANKLVKEVKVETEGVDPILGTKFPLTVTMKLSAPSLKFVIGDSGTCQLTMPIESGQYQIASNQPKPIQANVYQIVGTLPLAALDGRTGKLSTAGDVIAFGSDGGNEAHVILDFTRSGDRAYAVEARDGKKHDEDDILRIYVAPKLADYFSTNVSAIEYALASVSDAAPSGDVVLQPKSFVFASAGGATNGVLSLYIQTKGGSADPGTLHPVFQPGGSEMLRIPRDHTAAIVFSHDMVVRQYVRAQLAKAGYGVSEVQSSAGGIQMHVTVGKSVIKNASHHSFWGNFSVDGIDASLTKNPISLSIKDGKLAVSWSFEQTLEWSNNVTFAQSGTWGRVKLKISMSKSVSLSLSDEEVVAKLAIGSSDYHVSTKAEDLSFWETFGGGVEYVPSELKDLSLDLPAVNLSLGGLGFFPITNLLFPGQRVIQIDTSTGILTPYDLLLTGQIVDTLSTGGPAATHLAALVAFARGTGRPMLSTPAPAKKDTRALINDILTQDEVAVKVFELVADGDPQKLTSWASDSGYDATPEGIEEVMASLHSAEGTDIRLWGGVYEISAPAALDGKKLKVSTKTGRVTLEGTPLDIRVEAADRIAWDAAGKTYDITFAEHVRDDGQVDPNTFAGTITTPAVDGSSSPTTETIEGNQVLYDPAKDWHEIKEITQFGLIIGVLSGLVTLGMAVRELWKGRKNGKAQEQVAESQKALNDEVELQVVDKAGPEPALWEGIERQLKKEIEQTTNKAIDSAKPDFMNQSVDEVIGQLPTDEQQNTLREAFDRSVWSAMKPQIERELGPGLKWLTEVLKPSILDQYAKPRFEAAQAGGANGYIAKLREVTVTKARQEALVKDANMLWDEIGRITVSRDKTNGELTRAREQLEEVQDELKKEDLSTEAREAALKQQEQLEGEIERNESALAEAEKREQAARERESADRDQVSSEDSREEKAREAAEKRGREIFAE